MQLVVLHETRYTYPGVTVETHNDARLQPFTDDVQTCLEFEIATQPATNVYSLTTPWGAVHHFAHHQPHSQLVITTHARVQTAPVNPFVGLNLLEDDAEFYNAEQTRQQYAEFLAPTNLVPDDAGSRRIADRVAAKTAPSTAAFLIGLNRTLHRIIVYDPGSSNVNSTLREVLTDQRGVCQDFAHVMLAVCRSRGIPARYVSGYVSNGADGQDMHADLAMHAWVECLLPDSHWHGFDPTNDLLVNEQYIRVHIGRDYSDVTPTRGVYRGPAVHTLTTSVTVTNVDAGERG